MSRRRKRQKPKFKPFEGMDKLFTTRAKRSSKALPTKGSTWLKTQQPTKRKKWRLGGNK